MARQKNQNNHTNHIMGIINWQILSSEIEKARAILQQQCEKADQNDDISPTQEMAAFLPIILNYAYSLRLISKGERREQLIGELAEFMKENAFK